MPVALAVALGGAFGALARYAVVLALRRADPAFPWGTLLVNVAGSFLIGAAWAYFLARPGAPEWLRLGLMTGLLGGYTTLSAISLDTVLLLQTGAHGAAALNVAANVGLSVLACFAALWMCRALFAP